MIIKVVTLGCKVNQCESASIVAALKSAGHNASEGLAPADVYILNTCSVTGEADRKSRQYLSKMRKINPSCKIIALGCSSQYSAEKFEKENVIAIGGTKNKVKFVIETLETLVNDKQYNTLSDIILCKNAINDGGSAEGYCYEPYPVSDKTRAFIKIQDGCNRFCTYCIIPFLRGRSRSRAIEDIIKECENVSSKEIVLTGIDISSYGKDLGVSLADLILSLSDIPIRKRIGSIECEVIDERLLGAMGESGFCPHFHLSLQSGSSEVLKTMNRHYDCDYFYGKIKLIREFFPNAGITTDVIVGFPTETDRFFNESCEFIENCGFSDIHVFPYSSRSGTLASKKYRVLPADTVKKRVEILLGIKKSSHNNFLIKNIGSTASVYIEDSENGYNVGYTPNYIKVYSQKQKGAVCDLRLVQPLFDGLLGE